MSRGAIHSFRLATCYGWDFSWKNASSGTLGFIGKDADENTKRLYVGKRVPDEYRKQGEANPTADANLPRAWANLVTRIFRRHRTQ